MSGSQLAKDVAVELERRRRRRRLIIVAAWAAAIVLAILYLRCGKGWGLGSGQGAGAGEGGSGSASAPATPRCVVRVSSAGIAVDDVAMTREQAVATCKRAGGAIVTVTGDARQGDWDDLHAAFDAAGITIYSR